jgi:transcriptional regulator with XRE-family HTH domain
MEPEKLVVISKWIMKKFLEYKSIQERDVTQAEFAEYLGVSESTVSQWINKVQPPDKHSADLVALKLGPEIYDLLGLARPNTIPLDQLPHAVRDRLTTAVYEVNSELESRGLSNASPEAEDITIKIFEKHGFKYTRTTKK